MKTALQHKLKVDPEEKEFELVVGDSREKLAMLETESFQCCVTSPPYWGLRDYDTDGQIGAEESVHDYVADLVRVFAEVKRLLKGDGTLWLNIGDSYTSGNRTWRDSDKKNPGRAMSYRPPTPLGLKPKDLIGVPWLVAFALQQDGWYLRSDIIWHKPNCQPESVKDRPTRSHEYVFLFSKSKEYYYNHEAVKERSETGDGFRNRRSVWSINTNGFKGAHFAVFPPELVRVCLLGGTSRNDRVLDPFLGTGTVAEVALEQQRKCTGIELNPNYAKMAKQRVQQINRRLFANG
jgi:DNA modification methylase